MFAVLCFVLVVSAIADAARVARAPNAICCTPDQWEGTQFIVGGVVTDGKAISTQSLSQFSYDATQMRTAATVNTTTQGVASVVKVIQLFQQRMQYNFNMQTGACVKAPLDTPFEAACIPDNAVALGEFAYGAGAETLMAKGFSFTRQAFSVYAAVTSQGCIPIAEDVFGTLPDGRGDFFENVNFANISPGIQNPNVFTPPASCS